MKKPQLIPNWKNLWKAASVQILALGAVFPELLQVLADNTSLLPWLDDGYKSGIRLAAIIVAVLVRPIKQPSVSGPSKE
jgi:hypothetical protein